MKTSALVLAALLATAGGAYAGNSVADLKFPQTTKQERVVLDRQSTGSIKRVYRAEPGLDHSSDKAISTTDKQFGIDVSPWMMPSIH